ncbi:MAG: endonuclease V [Actinomycetota bacterium]
MSWPDSPAELIAAQIELASAAPEPWSPPDAPFRIGACFACFSRGRSGRGEAGELAWAGAALTLGSRPLGTVVVRGVAGAPYESGLLALREGALLEAATRALEDRPAVLLVNATGRDHPRRAGLALHLGSVLDLPTVGVTHRPLLASGAWPESRRGATAPLLLDGEIVGVWLCTRPGRRPICVHTAWRTDVDVAAAVVISALRRARTPEAIRRARRAARLARAGLLPASQPP